MLKRAGLTYGELASIQKANAVEESQGINGYFPDGSGCGAEARCSEVD